MDAPLPPPTPQRDTVVRMYTDGSGSRGKCSSTTPAGWGFVRLENEEVSHTARGPVSTDHTAAHYLGATVGSNNTGELTAWMEAALYELGREAYRLRMCFVAIANGQQTWSRASSRQNAIQHWWRKLSLFTNTSKCARRSPGNGLGDTAGMSSMRRQMLWQRRAKRTDGMWGADKPQNISTRRQLYCTT